MKMHNPRAGHAPAFGIEILYFAIGLVAGWPIAIPALFLMGFLSEQFDLRLSGPFASAILYISIIIGIYVHFKIWTILWSAFKAWWMK